MYKHKEKHILDFSGVKTWVDIHAIIEKEFDFPDYYGANWDAFWDLLRSDCDANRVIIKGEKELPNEFRSDLEKMHEILRRNSDFCNVLGLENFSYIIIS